MAALVDDFCARGYLAVRGAVPADVVRRCVEAIEAELRTRGVDPRDPATWTGPPRDLAASRRRAAHHCPASGGDPRAVRLRADADVCPVERAILRGLER